MLKNWLMDELAANECKDFIYQQDSAPPHWSLTVRAYLNDNLPRRWIGHAGGEANVLLKWPPRSPDLTPCDFFCGNMCSFWFMSPLPLFLQTQTSSNKESLSR